jgi:uncharacterized protein (DUF1501 family)
MDRRKFIRNSAAFVTLPILLNGQAIQVLAGNSGFNPKQTNGKILILIQLDGGNDGLNTLVPLNMYDNLVKVRPEVVLPKDKILPLTNLQGLHPSLTEIKELFTEEKMMFLQNIGYPNPNLSHFRSKEIVLAASNSKTVVSSGWLGRYANSLHPGFPENYPSHRNPHPLAITIGASSSPSCQGDNLNLGVVLKDLNSGYESQSGEQEYPETPYGFELKYVAQIMKSTEKYLNVVSETADLSETLSTHWPENNSLADRLKIVARLINGGLETPIYIVNKGGFDTHSGQVVSGRTETGKHADLLKIVSQAVYAFQDELKLHNKEDDVISLIYSEFGRRIASNKSFGTDHGEAYPMMLFGSQVNPTVFGENPTIPEQVEKRANVPMKIDFRSVYASILNQWFGVTKTDIKTILFDDFEFLPILKSTVSTNHIPNNSDKVKIQPVFPNPVTNQAQIEFFTTGGRVSLELFTYEGKKIKNIISGKFPRGNQYITFSRKGLENGQYLLVLQNNTKRTTQKLIIQ